MTLNDKVQIGDSTTSTSTGTSTTWHCPYTQPKAEQGWECPRCGRINAPWVRQCDCSRDNLTFTWSTSPTGQDEWWKNYVTCNGTSSQIQLDSDTFQIHPESDPKYQVGGSDYWNPLTKAWENVSTNISNLQREIDDLRLNYKIEEKK